MGQLQRDDRRRVRQETVELWEIEREAQHRESTRQGTRFRKEREIQQIELSRQEGRSRERRSSQQERGTRQRRLPQPEDGTRQRRPSQSEGETRQRRLPQPEGGSRQRKPSQLEGKPCQVREGGQMRRSPREYPQQLGRSPQPRRSEHVRPVPYRQREEIQLVSSTGYRQPGNPRPIQSIKRRRARRRKVFLSRAVVFLFIVLCLVLIYQTTGAVYRFINRDTVSEVSQKDKGIASVLSDKIGDKKIMPPEIMEDYLEVNDYSRPGTELKKVNSVFVHYTANPGTSAQNNRSYFANLAETHERAASAHLIIGYEGEVIQCIPLDEQAYGVKGRNEDSLSIECCYLAEDGSFTPETYETLLHTLAWLLDEYDLTTEDILRHYDCGGKKCPLYYVEHEDAWEELLADVEAYEARTE